MHNNKVEITAANSTYTQGWDSCLADTFVQAESSVLRTNFCAKKPALRVAAKRYAACYDNNTVILTNLKKYKNVRNKILQFS
jgi:hypothetical protein